MNKRHQLQFNNLFVEFCRKLKKSSPEMKTDIKQSYKEYKKMVDNGRRIEYISNFVSRLTPWGKAIATYDEQFFSELDEPLEFLPKVDFRQYWGYFDDAGRESIFQYLQHLLIIGTHVIKTQERIDSLITEQETLISEMMESLSVEKTIKTNQSGLDLHQLEEMEAFKGFDISKLEKLLDNDNILSKLIFELMDDIKAEVSQSGLSNPMDYLKSSNIDTLRQKITTKLEHFMTKNNLSQEDLIAQFNEFTDSVGIKNIEEMGDKLLKQFGTGPLASMLPQLMKKLTDNLKQLAEFGEEVDIGEVLAKLKIDK